MTADQALVQLPTVLDLAAIATGGLFGSALAVQRRLPIIAVMLIGILTALGGGMLRDLLLGVPVVAMLDRWYLPVAVAAALVGMPLARRTVEHPVIGNALDAMVLGLYVVVGTEKAAMLGFPAATCVFVGILTAVGGGTLAEVLLGSRPTVLREGPWFASAALVGAVVVVIGFGRIDDALLAVVGVAATAALRYSSVRIGYAAPSVANLQQLRRRRG